MRAREISIEENKYSAPSLTTRCEWPGCVDKELQRVPALHLASYKVRTGRVQAGQWQERKMGLCDKHLAAFRENYMKNLCPLCDKNPIDENSDLTVCEECRAKA